MSSIVQKFTFSINNKTFIDMLNKINSSYILNEKRNFHSSSLVKKHYKELEFKVYRWNPEKPKEKPTYKSYKVQSDDIKQTVLDGLLYIKENEDPTLAFRHHCHNGKCGSCAVNINGKNVLACSTPIDDKQEVQKISPLPNIPVVKDLVLDLTHYYEQYKNIQPWIMRKKKDEHGEIIKEPDREILQTTKERKKIDGYYECNLCACCSSSCPNYWRDADAYLGPSTILNSFRWIRDSRDGFHSERKDALQGPDSLFRCHGEMNCMSNCPLGLNPAKAIAKLKLAITKEG